MAAHATHVSFAGTFMDRVSAITATISKVFWAFAYAQSRQAEIETLMAKSDAELAQMGLERQDIPQHVFRNLMHL